MLILCKKPSVARNFAEALGCEGRRGYYQNKNMTITCYVGHLFELAKPESYHDNPEYLYAVQASCRGKAVDHVQSTSTREVSRSEKLLNITGLQKKAFKFHGYTPEKTLEIAQALYEKPQFPPINLTCRDR